MIQANDIDAKTSETQRKRSGAQRWNFALSAAGIAAALGFGLGGAVLHLPSGIVLALLPVVLIYFVRREPELYAISKPKRDPRTDLGFGFMACSFGLILGNRNVHFIGMEMLFECAGLVGLLCCVGILAPARKNPQFWSTLFGTFLIGGVYGWGLAGAVDSGPDRSTPAYYATTVVSQYQSYHRGTTYHHLVVEPWGPAKAPNDLTVSAATYENAPIGSQVCLELHSGLIYLPWYRMVECRDARK